MTSNVPAHAAAPPASSASGAPAARHRPPSGRLVAAIALVVLIGTGCSSAPAETGSAVGGQPAATDGPTGDVGDQTGPTGPAPSPAELQELLEQRREASRCMRENGVEDFPDPDANAHVLYYGDDPDMKSASEKCDALLGRGSK